MSIRKNIMMVFILIGGICFAIGIVWLIASAIQGGIYLVPLFVGLGMLLVLPLIGYGLELYLNRPRPDPVRNSISPAERMEGGTVLYCPLCHANLGSDAPPKCPECGLKLR